MAATVKEAPKLAPAPGTITSDAVISDINSDVQSDSENRTEGSEGSEAEGSEAYDVEDSSSSQGSFEPESSLSGSQSDDEFSDTYAKDGSSVCPFCEKLLMQVLSNNKESKFYRIPKHYESFWHMKKSAHTCGLCWSLIEGTEEHLDYFPQRYPQDRNMELRNYEIGCAGYTMPFCNAEAIAGAGIHEFTLYIGGCADDPRFRFLLMAEDGSGSIPQRAIWSDRVPLQLGTRIPVVNEWLDACQSQHQQCKQRMSNRRSLPTRLIDLFGTPHPGSFDPHLIDTSTLDPQNTQYTTLSHRWGDEQPVRTLKANLQAFKRTIFPLYSRTKRRIPRTFNDALKITRALGLRYIWIDSLCIVQDDERDWQHEAMRMADVYRGSYLNIAAIDSPNCNGGCALDLGWGAMSLSGPNMEGRRVRVRPTPADPVEVFSSPLNMRGWVFQELTLAPRVLYCGRKQMYWQCTEKVHSEDGYIDHSVALNIPGDREGLAGEYYDWTAWVADFSQREFTVLTDRLPALHGVVQHYAEGTEHVFLLGLWKESLLRDLAWRTRLVDCNVFAAYPTERSGLANVPSWSWLSLHVHKFPGGVVYFPSTKWATMMTDIREVEVLWESVPLFSSIASTKLVLEGPLQKHSFQWDRIRRRLFGREGEDSTDTDVCVVRLDEMLPDDVEFDEEHDYWCLQLDCAKEIGEKISKFLVLEEAEANAKSDIRVFRRIGCGRMEHLYVDFSGAEREMIELI
ncbi:HET-domain-containing protein [Byssothecium circinans]|uniref:HET-domain-containing protein n=1 Tax=Byssothecium circinans TaxID=147558 RepID=A0A6A5TQS9_9PLEO|nr:HET-domain-containing protein [Byssothecium circinans]